MPTTFSLKVLFWQAAVACICGVGLLGVQLRTSQWVQQQSSTQLRVLRNSDPCDVSEGDSRPSFCGEQQKSTEPSHWVPKYDAEKEATPEFEPDSEAFAELDAQDEASPELEPDTVEASAEPDADDEDSPESTEQDEDTPQSTKQDETTKSFLEMSHVPPEEVPGHHTHHAWVQAHKYGDLPMLPVDRSPDSDTWDNSVSICACMLEENTTDVREWLLYHK